MKIRISLLLLLFLASQMYAETKLELFNKLAPINLENAYKEYLLSGLNIYLDNSITVEGVVTSHRIDMIIQVDTKYYKLLNIEDSFLFKDISVLPIQNIFNAKYFIIHLKGTTDKGGGRMGDIGYQIIIGMNDSSVLCSEYFKYFIDDDNIFKGPTIQVFNSAIKITNEITFSDDTLDDGSNQIVISDDQNGYFVYKLSSKKKSNLAVSIDSKVRVRSSGNLQGDQLGYLNIGDLVEVLEIGNVKMKINDMNDYWYRIQRLSDGLTGWSYGAFLKMQE